MRIPAYDEQLARTEYSISEEVNAFALFENMINHKEKKTTNLLLIMCPPLN